MVILRAHYIQGGAFHLHDDVLWSPDRHCPANASSSSSSLSFSPSAAAAATPEVVPCESWSFDTSDFSRTAVTDNGWVCEDGHLVTNAFFSATVGAIVGTIIFNTLSDVAGRKCVTIYCICNCSTEESPQLCVVSAVDLRSPS